MRMPYTISRVDAEGRHVYTAQDFDEQSRTDAGESLGAALRHFVENRTGWYVDLDGDYEFHPTTAAAAYIWDELGNLIPDENGGNGRIDVEYAQWIVDRANVRLAERQAATAAAAGTGAS